jgi:hypothetical protein
MGRTFDRLRVTAYAGKLSNDQWWLCQCECGTTLKVGAQQLQRRATRSCGCIAREMIGALRRRHGMADSPEHRTWRHMIERCNSPADRSYARYGGRGVRVCERWLQSFENFFADMGSRPSPEHSIDRIDNAKGYEPSNCRWATRVQQSRNRSIVKPVTIAGVTLTLPEWAERVNLPLGCIRARLSRGWSPEDAVSFPVDQRYVHPRPGRTQANKAKAEVLIVNGEPISEGKAT